MVFEVGKVYRNVEWWRTWKTSTYALVDIVVNPRSHVSVMTFMREDGTIWRSAMSDVEHDWEEVG